MPKIKSAKKALRQNQRRKKRNLGRKKTLRGAIREYERLLSSGKLEDASKYLSSLYRTIDKSRKGKVVKKNKSNRLKSRLTRQLLRARSVKTSS